MSVPFSNTKLRVPKGFQNILEGLARECLRNQPENIFEFGAKYFEQLLQVREQTGHDPAIHGARLEDRFYNNDSFKSPSVDVGDPQQQDAALKIQTEYRRHAAEQEVADMQLEEAAIKIQSGFRGFQDRQKVLQMKDPEAFEKQQKELEKKTSQSQEEEVDIDLEDPEVANAAVKIQAGFKGYKARKEVKERKEESDSPDKVSDIDFSDPEVNNAVVKIQAGFRGHLTRQEIKSKKSNVAMQNAQEDVDIDLNDPELQEAAAKIQAGFRGFQARQEVKELMVDKENDTETTESQQAEEKKEQEEKTEDVDIDLTDPDTEKAAMKIQAGFRGYKTRKEVKDQMESKQEETKEESKTGENQDEGIDIDLNDPEIEKAATKIQAGFKGYKTRKEYKDKADGNKEEESKVEGKEETSDAKEESKEEGGEEKKEAVDIDLNDPEVDKAAVKIQATFKGYKTRKDLKSAKGDEEGVDKTDTAAGDEKE